MRLDERGDDVVVLVVAVVHARSASAASASASVIVGRSSSTASACATSSTVSRWRASPSLDRRGARARRRRSSTGSSPSPRSSSASARASELARSSSPSGSSRNSVLRDSSGPVSEKNGFSVVAPTSTSRPSSTNGSSTSCCAREKRCTSSRNRIVPWPCSPSRARARSATSRTSFTPALTGRSVSNAFSVSPAIEPGDRRLAGSGRAPEHRPTTAGPTRSAPAAACPRRADAAGRRPRRASGDASAPRAAPARQPLLHRRRKQIRTPSHRPQATSRNPQRITGGGGVTARACSGSRPSSVSWAASIGLGASVSGSAPDWVFGNAITSRMFSSPASSATNRSMPIANPACGGAP